MDLKPEKDSPDSNKGVSRRVFLKMAAFAAGAVAMDSYVPIHKLARASEAALQGSEILTKPIPHTGEKIPVIGMGTWQTFDVGGNPQLIADRAEVLKKFFEMGGGMIDSSPMYGSSEEVLGTILKISGPQPGLFSASKIWTLFQHHGQMQFRNSLKLWGLDRFDLFQVHNLLSWPKHLETLNNLKQEGIIRYTGITTSHGRRHEEVEKILRSEPVDFLQITYNIEKRAIEDRILPLAQDKGVAVIANRPFGGGRLVDHYQKKPLPEWAVEFDCHNWPQFLLKFIVSHPAITCAIPATTQVEHMTENMSAAYGALPDAKMRRRMIQFIEA